MPSRPPSYTWPNNDASTLYGIHVAAVSVTLLVTALAWIVMRVNRQTEERLGLDDDD